MENNEDNTNEEYITINIDDTNINSEDIKQASFSKEREKGRRHTNNKKASRIGKRQKKKEEKRKEKMV